MDIEADPGETVAIVGPTGARKSTIVKLLLQLYDVSDEAVRADSHDVRDVRLADLRSSIGYVRQNTLLFDGTVAENIRYGRFDADREDVTAAADAAEARGFIQGLSEAYDTRVGEHDVKLWWAMPAHRYRPDGAAGPRDSLARRGDLGRGHGDRVPARGVHRTGHWADG